jgi:hypothetical protein
MDSWPAGAEHSSLDSASTARPLVLLLKQLDEAIALRSREITSFDLETIHPIAVA